jgi:hypothetical protein
MELEVGASTVQIRKMVTPGLYYKRKKLWLRWRLKTGVVSLATTTT